MSTQEVFLNAVNSENNRSRGHFQIFLLLILTIESATNPIVYEFWWLYNQYKENQEYVSPVLLWELFLSTKFSILTEIKTKPIVQNIFKEKFENSRP